MGFLSIDHLKYKYPMNSDFALNDISFNVEKGEFIGIIGENEAGKSTLCQAIVGLVPNFYKGSYGGKVVINGLNVSESNISDVATHVGIVFQNPFTQITGSQLTVYEEVAFGLENLGIPVKEMKERIDEALNILDIYEYRNSNPFDLSGGQMQRLAIASIIAMKPEILILDEPTSQLDPQGSKEVFEAVQSLSKKGMTIIMAEHKMENIAAYSDKVALLYQGKLIDFDVPSRVFSRNDLNKYGVKPPIYTEVCKMLGVKNENGLYPVTIEEAYDRLVNII